MNENHSNPNDPTPKTGLQDHPTTRKVFRILGFVFLGIGVTFMAIGLASFAGMAGGNSGFDGGFFFIYPGMGFLFLGCVFLMFGFMGAMARYSAAEQAPVAKDTTNYILNGTRDETAKTVAAVVKEVKSDSPENIAPICPKCGTKNEVGAKFCDHCGAPLTKTCPNCGEVNDGDSTFCRKCGKSI
jgi:ribosomal protein L40E/Na+-transporting methylmalonyl-CoA/oxaloacetate decarboxylase gamma subunit